jgi:ppGpp synthetase/RelA/SpoT-type nucleotidyltranferase
MVKDIHDVKGAPDRHLLEVREVLDQIKDRYYENAEQTAEWVEKAHTPAITKRVAQLSHLTSDIRRRGVETALQELAGDVDDVVEGLPRKRRRRTDDSEEEG